MTKLSNLPAIPGDIQAGIMFTLGLVGIAVAILGTSTLTQVAGAFVMFVVTVQLARLKHRADVDELNEAEER